MSANSSNAFPNATPVWFITGCSIGFGREFARAVLARGWRCIATARNKAALDDLAPEAGERLLCVSLDVTDPAQIAAAVAQARERFGAIDVLVNNAGYGYQSSIEEGEETQIRAQFDANVFGLFALTRAVLPVMREQKRGHVINITSVAGLAGFPGSGYYAASKHAVEGFSDALLAEAGPLGIKVTCVEPGPFRTEWAGRSLVQTPNRIVDYAETAGARMQRTAEGSGHQPGDPARAAQAIIRIAEVESPPRHFVLGAFGVDAVAARLRAALADIETWREAGLATDFPAGE
ncbi:NAD(P)-dependent dehydrogenase (short-subunit alcohol dehydrogenase family) [Paraburkholderia tropica]|uniref:oxidoreductase n=1 Tax=Paraburkholderia tropica TaxID=92647 RepID=UPI001613BC1E|nr:oxidoreductase [Paraburkholderia tropica]MBB2999198.1 NAD(P)-dependent dehydrogenase (short-subunit alcohol dehydrogenase family) [Paraburkholderia tropica]MBB6318902.1 NAD(P)-dependent dehydrogenase (short-subunit alcohol dehydrogenase family) [Paraburkholderia tropica]